MNHSVRGYVMVSLFIGVTQVAGCLASEHGPLATESVPEPALADEGVGAPDFTQHVSRRSEADEPMDLTSRPEHATAGLCPMDLYFHPNNGARGGWIESWRLCYRGGNSYQICTGGYAPVRYWNESSCGGTIHDYYPQGWNGWAQTGGGCC